MRFQWVQVSAERLEYQDSDQPKRSVAEVKRCRSYYEAVVFKQGQRSNRLLLYRGDSVTVAIETVAQYLRGAAPVTENVHSAQPASAQQEATALNQSAAATAPGSGEPIALFPR